MPSLYDDILEIARKYMGIAAEEYIRRRIRIVMGASSDSDPEEIGADRLDRLAAGIDMTAKVYLNAEKAGAFRAEILELAERHK